MDIASSQLVSTFRESGTAYIVTTGVRLADQTELRWNYDYAAVADTQVGFALQLRSPPRCYNVTVIPLGDTVVGGALAISSRFGLGTNGLNLAQPTNEQFSFTGCTVSCCLDRTLFLAYQTAGDVRVEARRWTPPRGRSVCLLARHQPR